VPADERPDQGAWLSGDGTYRYTLFRRWGQLFAEDAKPLVWVMLNPSTANADLDDQTVRKVRGFTVRAGYSWLVIVNLFAYRTGSPARLLDVGDRLRFDIVGPMNDHAIRDAVGQAGRVVVAWGGDARYRWPARVEYVTKHLLPAHLWCVGTTGRGDPRHPCYAPYSDLLPWPLALSS